MKANNNPSKNSQSSEPVTNGNDNSFVEGIVLQYWIAKGFTPTEVLNMIRLKELKLCHLLVRV